MIEGLDYFLHEIVKVTTEQRPDGDRQKGNVIDNIKLSSFNVEGLRGNGPYLETI
jgi:hypothetical protein